MSGDASSCVGAAGFHEQIQSFRVEMKMATVKLPGKLRRTRAVFRVDTVVMTAGVVQKREKHDDVLPKPGRGIAEVKALFQHPCPMRCAVQTVPIETILPPNLDEQAF